MSLPNLEISADRLEHWLLELAQHSEPTRDERAVTRRVFSPEHAAGRDFLKRLLDAEGISWRENSIGVLIARYEPEGCVPSLAPVASGSHIDAIPHAGRFDGTVGVLGAYEAIFALKRAGFKGRRAIEVYDFAEEPTVFSVGCLPSRIMGGFLDPAAAASLVDESGRRSFDQARAEYGFTGPIESSVLSSGEIDSWVELHIEQGPRLERLGKRIGIVTGISASSTSYITFKGEGGHAGAVAMSDRKADAMAAACAFAHTMREVVIADGSKDIVGTVGKFDVHPSATNSIPSEVKLSLDLRDCDTANRDSVLAQLQELAQSCASSFGASVEIDVLNQDPAAISDPEILQVISEVTAELGISAERLHSFAYHDTSFMALKTRTAMIFIPSKDGHSHRPEEFTETAEIADGVRVLAHTFMRLAS